MAVHLSFDQIILGTLFDGLDCRILIVETGQNDDWNALRRTRSLPEKTDALVE